MHDNHNFNYYYHFPADLTYPRKNMHMWTLCRHFRIDYEKSESYLINMTDWSVIFMQNPAYISYHVYEISGNNPRGV
jgi:hypothetical protein